MCQSHLSINDVIGLKQLPAVPDRFDVFMAEMRSRMTALEEKMDTFIAEMRRDYLPK